MKKLTVNLQGRAGADMENKIVESTARAERAQRELKEAFDRLSEATINAMAALERFEMVMKEMRAKNGNQANS